VFFKKKYHHINVTHPTFKKKCLISLQSENRVKFFDRTIKKNYVIFSILKLNYFKMRPLYAGEEFSKGVQIIF